MGSTKKHFFHHNVSLNEARVFVQSLSLSFFSLYLSISLSFGFSDHLSLSSKLHHFP